MPQVPKLQSVETSPLGIGYQSGRGATTDAFGIGGAVVNAGQAISQTGQIVDDFMAKEDERVATELDNELSNRTRELLAGDNGYYRAKGSDAVNRYGETDKQLIAIRDEIAGKAKSGRAREMFMRAADSRINSHRNSMIEYRNKEQDVSLNDTATVRIQEAADNGTLYYNNPKMLAANDAIIESEINSMAKRNGWTDDIRNRKLKEAHTVMYEQAIQTAVANGDMEQARSLLERYKFKMTGDRVIANTKGMKEDTELGEAQTRTDAIMAKDLSMADALAEARKIQDPKVRELTETRVKERYSEQAEIKRLEDFLGASERLHNIQTTTDTIMAGPGTDEEKLELARAIEDPEMRQDVEASVINRINQRAQLEQAQIRATASQAFQDIANGAKVDAWALSHPKEWQTLIKNPETVEAMRRAEAATAAGKLYATSSDGKTLDQLTRLGTAELANVDPLTYRQDLTAAEYNSLVGLVSGAQKAIQDIQGDYSIGRRGEELLQDMAPKYMKWGKEDQTQENKDLQAAAINQMNAYIAQLAAQGVKPTDEQLTKYASSLMSKIYVKSDGFFGWVFNLGSTEVETIRANIQSLTPDQKSRLAVPLSEISEDAVNQVNELFKQFGITATQDMIEQYVGAELVRDTKRQKKLLGLTVTPDYARKVAIVESGGDPNAKAKTSSATGLFQFTKSTWLEAINSMLPQLAKGKTEEEILSMRTDPDVSRQVFDAFTERNAANLRKAGFENSDGNLYLAHFAGTGGAKRILNAPDDALVEDVLGPGVVKANSFLKGRTVLWMKNWANKKMGMPAAEPNSIFGGADEKKDN